MGKQEKTTKSCTSHSTASKEICYACLTISLNFSPWTEKVPSLYVTMLMQGFHNFFVIIKFDLKVLVCGMIFFFSLWTLWHFLQPPPWRFMHLFRRSNAFEWLRSCSWLLLMKWFVWYISRHTLGQLTYHIALVEFLLYIYMHNYLQQKAEKSIASS